MALSVCRKICLGVQVALCLELTVIKRDNVMLLHVLQEDAKYMTIP